MNILPRLIQWDKHCLVYCGPEWCDCSLSEAAKLERIFNRKAGEEEMTIVETHMPQVGDLVTYTNPTSKKFNALVTAVWGPNCINLVYVVDELNQTDNYGRKLARESSLMRKSSDSAHGQFWESL